MTEHMYQSASMPYLEDEELFSGAEEQTNNLHTYYMSQFNLELENGSKNKSGKFNENLKVNGEESYNFEILNNWTANGSSGGVGDCDFHVIDGVIENVNINEDKIQDVLLDLDEIELDSTQTDTSGKLNVESNYFERNCDYIDDESLIDELCREDNEPYRLTPDIFNDSYLSSITNDKSLLPPMEAAFSKHCCSYNNVDQTTPEISAVDANIAVIPNNNEASINIFDAYSYPNNILYNINNKNYVLPDTPTSCTEFSYDRGERKISVSESIESDVQSSSYYDENSEELDDDELFINLDDFGFTLEKDGDFSTSNQDRVQFSSHNEKKFDKDKFHGQRICLWECCHETYPNQSTLVEHIERSHVNTHKGDEFSCLWRECARARRPFNARYKLLIHMRVHSGHKPNRCHHPGCGKAFSRLENLKIHVRSHTGERPYACPAPHCRKAFSNSSDRAKHQRTHFNARPYACGAVGCGKRYTDPSSLRKHVKSHPHIADVPRTCAPPPRVFRKSQETEQTVPRSPAKLATLRCIRNKLATVPRLQVIS